MSCEVHRAGLSTVSAADARCDTPQLRKSTSESQAVPPAPQLVTPIQQIHRIRFTDETHVAAGGAMRHQPDEMLSTQNLALRLVEFVEIPRGQC